MTKPNKAWCLCNPEGVLYLSTLKEDRQECWVEAFVYVAHWEGPEWRERFWKRRGPSQASARRKGWRVVRVEVREEGE